MLLQDCWDSQRLSNRMRGKDAENAERMKKDRRFVSSVFDKMWYEVIVNRAPGLCFSFLLEVLQQIWYKLLHTLALTSRIIIIITFHEVNSSPHSKRATKSSYYCRKGCNTIIEKFHITLAGCFPLLPDSSTWLSSLFTFTVKKLLPSWEYPQNERSHRCYKSSSKTSISVTSTGSSFFRNSLWFTYFSISNASRLS